MKCLGRGVTVRRVLFWTWQAASALILLYNFDLVAEMYSSSLSMTHEFWKN